MSEVKATRGLLSRLADVLRGADTVRGEAMGAEAETATLQRELVERDERVARLEASCERLEETAARQAEAAREAAALQLLEAVAGPLSQLATMRSLAEHVTSPDVGDVLRLTDSLQQAFAAAGLEPIGSVREVVPYDPSLHRLADREQPKAGDRVRIRFIGFRFGQRVVRSALVSKEED